MCVSENFAYEDYEQALDSARRCTFALPVCVNDGEHHVHHSAAVDREESEGAILLEGHLAAWRLLPENRTSDNSCLGS